MSSLSAWASPGELRGLSPRGLTPRVMDTRLSVVQHLPAG